MELILKHGDGSLCIHNIVDSELMYALLIHDNIVDSACPHVCISLVHYVLIVNWWLPSNNRLPVSTIARTTSGTSVLMVYVQYSTSSHNLQIYRIWYNSILIMRELTMVGGFVMKCVPTLD